MRIDPYKHKEKYLKWKEKTLGGIPEISKYNSDLVKKYLEDMEKGANVSSASAKGARSYIRLNTLKEKMVNFSKRFTLLYGLDKVTDISEDQLIGFFADMKNGIFKKKNGSVFKSPENHAKLFKAFWHWWQKINRKQGVDIPDITVDLSTRCEEKPDWVYLTETEVKLLVNNAKNSYKALILFLYDTGIRAPTELMNVRVSDLFNDCKELFIREEASKTFGRRIKLMLCSDVIKDYIAEKKFNQNDLLFPINPKMVNKYFKRLAFRVLGDNVSPAGQKYSDLTMYDFRHCACCYWLPRYKSESALKYRFGWKKSDKIHYYSELLGMKDTITEDDLLVDTTKTELEQRLTKTEKEKEILQDRMKTMELQMAKILELTKQLGLEVKNG